MFGGGFCDPVALKSSLTGANLILKEFLFVELK